MHAGWQSGGERETVMRAKHIGENAQALRVVLDRVEQQGRAFLVADGFGDGADLDVPVGAFDAAQLTELFDLADEAAKVAGIRKRVHAHLCFALRSRTERGVTISGSPPSRS